MIARDSLALRHVWPRTHSGHMHVVCRRFSMEDEALASDRKVRCSKGMSGAYTS